MTEMILRRFMWLMRITTGFISDDLNTRLNYFGHYRRLPNLRKPSTFCEKLCKLKIENYNKNELVKRCADKYLVRSYVSECGLQTLLNKLIGVYDKPYEIIWESLPKSFAIKYSIGQGYNLFIEDKNSIKKEEIFKAISTWRKSKPWLKYSEYQYKQKQPRILIERMLDLKSDSSIPEDYKIYCFNGVPKAILVMSGRESTKVYGYFMDLNWRFLGDSGKYKTMNTQSIPPKPKYLDIAIEAAAKLAMPFPFVRIDFYFPTIESKPVFGEMTFTPAGCIYTSEIPIEGKSMGDLLII